MKKLLCLFLAAALACGLSGCTNPNSVRLDLYRGYGDQLKLIHLNASTGEKEERMAAFLEALESGMPLEKDFSMFAYYPDYKLKISGKALIPEGADAEGDAPGYTVAEAAGQDSSITVMVDINGEFVDFYFPGPAPEESHVIYRSKTSAEDFKKLVHHA